MKNSKKLKTVFIGFMAFFVLIIFINHQLTRQMNALTKKPELSVPLVKKEMPKVKEKVEVKQIIGKNILRIERKDPREDYTESIILVDKKEVAQFKNKNGKIFDLIGVIPKEKIKFISKWKNTYGYEYYHKGKRNGLFKEYYSNDQIKEEAEYRDGRLLTRKGYFHDGVLRREEDYTEARFMAMRLTFGELKYVGKGKIFRSDGSLKIEWQIIDNGEDNFLRVYDSGGGEFDVKYFDAQGDPVIEEIPSESSDIEQVASEAPQIDAVEVLTK